MVLALGSGAGEPVPVQTTFWPLERAGKESESMKGDRAMINELDLVKGSYSWTTGREDLKLKQ